MKKLLLSLTSLCCALMCAAQTDSLALAGSVPDRDEYRDAES